MQQHLRLIKLFLIQPYMFRATNSPIFRSTLLTVYTAFGTVYRHCCRPVNCTKRCIYSQKNAPEDERICRPKNVGLNLKILIKRRNCCNLFVVYIVVLVMHGHTNITISDGQLSVTAHTCNTNTKCFPSLMTRRYVTG